MYPRALSLHFAHRRGRKGTPMSDRWRQASRTDLTNDDLDRAAALVKVLDSRTRLDILLLLAEKEMAVHQLVAELGKSQPLISQHLRVLRATGLVTSARKGREVLYALAEPGIIAIIAELAAIVDPLPTTPEPVRD